MLWEAPPPTSKAAEVWLAFIDDNKTKYFFLEGAVRSSKTFGSILAWCDWVENFAPPGPLIMMGNTRETLIQNVIHPLLTLVNGEKTHAILNRGTGTLRLFGRDIYLFGAGNITAMRRLQGKGAVGAYCDEAPTYPRDVFHMLGTRTAAEGIKIIATMNPDNPNHWMMDEYLNRLDKVNGRVWHFDLDDNPFLSEKVKSELKSQYTGVWYQRYIMGRWVMAEGRVYDFFTDSLSDGYVVDTIPPDLQSWVIGADYGTVNPTTWLLAGYSPSLREWYVTSEYWYDSKAKHRQKTDREYTDDLADFLQDQGNPLLRAIMIDPSAASWIADMRKARKQDPKYAYIQYVRGADNAVIDGIRDSMTLLHNHKVRIYKQGCPFLVEGLQNYLWDEKAAEKGEDQPLKEGGPGYNDHSCDAARYLCREIKRLGF